jgi:hypothetical protein
MFTLIDPAALAAEDTKALSRKQEVSPQKKRLQRDSESLYTAQAWMSVPNQNLGGYLVMWEKPAYEVVETCCEISAYVYTK